MKKIIYVSIALIGLLSASCFGPKSLPTVESKAKPITHEKWTVILQNNVTDDGCVDYEGLIKDSTAVNEYLAMLESHHPNDSWTEDERFAYWANAYNGFIVRIMIRNYPLSSIRDLNGSLVDRVWFRNFIKIEGAVYSLNDIEHNILRPKFEDARVHAAINCASISCPPLFNKAFEAKTLDSQLDYVTKKWINDPTRNKLTSEKVEISKIFSWFSKDFTKGNQTVIDFLNKYSEVKINADADISYLDYDWGINNCK